jgi:hypothetical protein
MRGNMIKPLFFLCVSGNCYYVMITCTHWFFHTQFTDPNSIQLWRYEDPELGPRKMPAFNSPIQGAVRIEDNAVFCVDVENKNIELAVNGTRYRVGSQIIYIVE